MIASHRPELALASLASGPYHAQGLAPTGDQEHEKQEKHPKTHLNAIHIDKYDQIVCTN